MSEEKNNQEVSNLWYLVVIFLGVVGGLIAWVANRDKNPKKAKKLLLTGIATSLIFLCIHLASSFHNGGKSKEAMIIHHMSKIRLTAIIFEDDNGGYFGLENNSEIKHSKNNIISSGGTNFNINATEKQYCAEVQLKSGYWYCVDSDIVSRKFSTNPACSTNNYTCN